MVKIRIRNKRKFEQALKELLKKEPLRFSHMKADTLPEEPGVYLITRKNGNNETPYYVGRTKNINNRVYKEHVKRTGFKKYLINETNCSTLKDAKNYATKYCAVRWLKEEKPEMRQMMEGYFTALLSPKCGMYEEH